MTFNSNVAPKKIKKKQPTPWECFKCEIELPYWTKRCHLCGEYRRA